MLDIGATVKVPPPFGDGETSYAVVSINYVSKDGLIVDAPSDIVQYTLDNGLSYDGKYLEEV